MNTKLAIESGDASALVELLRAEPARANELITWGKRDHLESHPLHFICDMLFEGTLERGRERELAAALIDAGADINYRQGDPLNAAASLGATEVGLLLLDAGAEPNGSGHIGETALHWAANTGNAVLVRRLLDAGALIDPRDAKYNSTPLGWALHGWDETPPPGNLGHHHDVIVRLVRAGAVIEPEWTRTADSNGRLDVLAALRG